MTENELWQTFSRVVGTLVLVGALPGGWVATVLWQTFSKATDFNA